MTNAIVLLTYFTLYEMDFGEPASLMAEKICQLAKDAATFDTKYPNNRGVFILAEVGNELKTRAAANGEEAVERVAVGMKLFGVLVSADMV